MPRRSSSAWARTSLAARRVVLAACLAAPPLCAQDRESDSVLEQFQVELSAVNDSVTLRQWERRFGRSDAQGDSATAMQRVRRGLVRLRLGQAGDGWSFGRAAADFGDAAELLPAWAFPWYARGLAHRAEADWHAANRLNLGKRVGFGPLEDAVDDFARALALDPTFPPALKALYDGAAALHDTTRIAGIVLPALRNAAAAGSGDPTTWLTLGRAERLMGDAAASVTALRRYNELTGETGVGLRELAWSGLLARDTLAEAAYYAGAAFDDTASVAAYRADLALIADDSTLAEFDGTVGPERAAFLRRLWTDRGHQAMRSPAERLAEHYRRISYADRHYGLEINRRHYSPSDMFRSGSMRFDDRGIIYIRYGEPDDRVLTVTFGIYPNETWRYRRADGDFLLHFAANIGGDLHDLRLIPSVFSIDGVLGGVENPALNFALLDRCEIHPPFCKFLNWGPNGRAHIIERERAIVQASVEEATTTDGYELRYPQTLDASAMAFAVGQSGGNQLVHVAYQVGLERPDSMPEGTVFRLPLRIRVNLLDRAGRSGGWVDTSTTFLLPGGGATREEVEAVGRVTLEIPPGHWRYRVAIAHGDSAGRVLPTDSLTVGNFDGSRLAVSDLVLSRSGRGAAWIPSPGDTAYFNPRIIWSRRDTLALYHEIYGLPVGAHYRARLYVRRGRRTVLTLGWEGQARAAITRVTRTLSFQPVDPGEYTLEVEVTRDDGVHASSSRRIRIEQR